MVLSLDKWINEVPEKEGRRGKETFIYIDLPDIKRHLETFNKKINLRNFIDSLGKKYENIAQKRLYVGAFPDRELNKEGVKKQKTYLDELKNLGFLVKSTIQYFDKHGQIKIKGIEVSIAVDIIEMLSRLSKKEKNEKDILIFCGDNRKYVKLTKFIWETFSKKIKLDSLSHIYEEDYGSFVDLLKELTIQEGSISRGGYIKYRSNKELYDIKQGILCLNPQTIRSKINIKKEEKKPKKAFLAIDYGNILHHFLLLKNKNLLPKTMKVTDVILSIKNKAEKMNETVKAFIYMGMPRITLKTYSRMRAKNERLIKFLNSHDLKTKFYYNELTEKGIHESGVDLMIAINSFYNALTKDVGKIILVSGDADFLPLIKKLKVYDKIKTEIWSFTEPLENCPLSSWIFLQLTDNIRKNFTIRSLNYLLKI